MPDTGYIKLYRKLLDNPVVCKDADHLATWVYLLLSATWKPYEVMFEGKTITMEPGQLITGRRTISSDLKLSESKVQRILKLLENEHLIEQHTTPRNRLISVVLWDTYQLSEQQDEQQLNNKRTTTEQQLNTNKNTKNIEEEKEIDMYVSDEPTPIQKKSDIPTLEEVIAYCQEENNGVDAVKFYNFYESKGWMIGKNKMKKWHSAISTWERQNRPPARQLQIAGMAQPEKSKWQSCPDYKGRSEE